jgi:hypothetical protein
LLVGDLFDLVIAQGGDVENRGDFVRLAGAFEEIEQVIVRIEKARMTLAVRSGISRAAAFEAENFKSGAGQAIAQVDAKFAGGKIRQAANLVDGFKAGTTGDDDFHVFKLPGLPSVGGLPNATSRELFSWLN